MAELPTGTVTFLFTDIEGSTRMLQRLGDRYTSLLEDHGQILRSAFREAGGYPVSTEGDSFFVVFQSAPAAVSGAAAAQRALEGHSWPDGEQVRVRMGLHTGEGKLGGDNYIGIDVHRTARIAAAGHGGQVLMSGSTRALVEGSLPAGISARDLGRHRLKDLENPEHLFQLLVDGLPDEFPPVRTLDARPNNLPGQLTSFVGRAREIEGIKEALGATRLLTLTGPGGTGKTRLSIQAGMELLGTFEHGVFFVPLASIEDPSLVPSTIAHTLGLAEETRPIMDTLTEHLRDKEMLVILDNFEQITEAAPVVADLLQAAPRVKALVTSRAVLHVTGEQEYPVPPLQLPDVEHLPPLDVLSQYEAVALFIQRAKAVHPGFAVTDQNAPAVAEICARLDGLPLAIELAAARVRVLSPDAILGRLQHRLALLTGGARDLPRRQQTLRDAIGWSYDLLDEPEQFLFARLSTFVGGCSLEASEAVCAPELEIDILDGLSSLVDKSLLRRLDTEAGEPRFRMLQVMREYAMERLDESKDAEEVHGRHAEFFLRLAEDAEQYLLGPDQARWLDTVELEHDNLRSAIEWFKRVEVSRALRLAAAIWRFWQIRGFLQEGRQRLTELLELPGGSDPVVHAKALEAAAGVKYWMADFEEARQLYEQTLEIHRARGDRAKEANALYNIGFTYSAPGVDHERARELIGEALSSFRELGDRSGEAKCLWGLSWSSWLQKEFDLAKTYLLQAEAAFRELRDPFSLGWALHTLGLIAVEDGRYDDADQNFREGLALFADARDYSGITLLLGDFAWLSERQGYRHRALLLWGAALELARRTGTDLFGVGIEVVGASELVRWKDDETLRPVLDEGGAMSVDEAIAYALKEPAAEGEG
ncbi:MAG TPA: tetratricopeptide repeat protein [Actinomycetota bacterium]|nr:tetratricopeptide repeat protein [Actinomycetota bacterium]